MVASFPLGESEVAHNERISMTDYVYIIMLHAMIDLRK
jgi:hypothetical protein